MRFFLLISMVSLVLPFTAAAQDFSDLPGWSSRGEILTFNRENLWDHINGAADQFLDLGFQQLRVRDFSKGSVSLSVELYDMGKDLNAFGIYALERSVPFHPLQIGTQAILYLPGQALLLKNIYYVKLYTYEGELTRESGKEVLRVIAKNLPGKADFPSELQSLPETGRLVGSEGYAREAFLGLNELKSCLYAEYEDESSKRFKFFRIVTDSPTADKEIYESLPDKWITGKFKEYQIRTVEIPYSGTTAVILTELGLLGVTDCQDKNNIQQRLKLLLSLD